MIPIDAASLSSNPISDAAQIAKKMPNCAAAPNKNMIGCDRSGPKSIIAPIPIKSRIGSASDALGFIPCAFLIQIVLFLWFGVRPVTAVVVAVAMTALVHWFFSSMMLVPLPRGMLDSVL